MIWKAAQQCVDAASEHFDEMIRQVPSGISSPDSVEGIRQAAREYNRAQEDVQKALSTLTNYVFHGKITPALDERLSGTRRKGKPATG